MQRLGNLFVFRGSFHLPGQAALVFYYRGLDKIYDENPDDAEAEKAFRRSVKLDPSAYFVHIELGNLCLKRGSREESVRAYIEALKYAPDEPGIRSALQYQIQRVSRDALAGISPLRDPNLE
jgi:tetratricopeptide (TPR) repeat protein